MGLQETEMRTMPITLDVTKERVFCRENVVAEWQTVDTNELFKGQGH